MNKRNILVKGAVIAIIIAVFASCRGGKESPGVTYMPDMAYSEAYETYTANPFLPDSMNAAKPVKGTIPLYLGIMGELHPYKPFHYPFSADGYEAAGAELKNPLVLDTINLAEGKRLFNIYCAICHGEDGKASGHIVTGDNVTSKFPPPPSYFSDNLLHLPEGKMFYTVHYGKNMMGSYATQLDQTQIWKVIGYVKSMQQDFINSQATTTASADTTKKK